MAAGRVGASWGDQTDAGRGRRLAQAFVELFAIDEVARPAMATIDLDRVGLPAQESMALATKAGAMQALLQAERVENWRNRRR